MILLDTQALLWLTTDRQRLSPVAIDCIREGSRRAEVIAVASSTLWEVAINFHKGSIGVPATLMDYLKGLEQAFQVLPITASIAERSIRFSKAYPKDPTDRIIGATAIVHNARLVTADEKIRASGEVDCVW